jgi:acetyltransferase-like isoleucine patch superfamily enzyme
MNSFYSREEVVQLGFQFIGEDVCISRKASIYGAEKMRIGNHVRIDDFALLSGEITIGNHVHVSAYVAMFGGDAGIILEDYVSVSSRTTLYALTDDYSGEYMANPMVPNRCRKVMQAPVVLKKHVLVAASCVVLPGITLEEGVSVGACSLVNKDCEAWGVFVGTPAKWVKPRKKDIVSLEELVE